MQVHLAVAYIASEKQDRAGRTFDSLAHMGVSVTTGALSTAGASSLLLGVTDPSLFP